MFAVKGTVCDVINIHVGQGRENTFVASMIGRDNYITLAIGWNNYWRQSLKFLETIQSKLLNIAAIYLNIERIIHYLYMA